MEVKVIPITNWMHVMNAARFTQRKKLLYKEPSDKFKKQIIKAEHSPLRALMFYIDFYDIPYYVSVHLCRHVHAQPFVSTSRPDIDGNQKPRGEQLKTDTVNMRLLLNAQEIINISKVRLCAKAELATRTAWKRAITELSKIEPLLAEACVPSCVYRSICPEIIPCGYTSTMAFKSAHKKYMGTFKCQNQEFIEDFEYNGTKLHHVILNKFKCAGCYFLENNIPCVHVNTPECGLGIFIKVEEDDSKGTD